MITDRSAIVQYVNPAFQTITGYAPEEVIGRTPSILKSGVHDRRFYEQLWETILSWEVFRAVFTNRRKDGELYYEEKTISALRDDAGRITHFVATGRDITRRMRAEEELRRSREELRAFAAHLETVREDERSRIAREIHDELGQTLTSLKIDLAWLAARLPRHVPAVGEKTREMSALIDATMQSVQRICAALRPGVLNDFGLVAAIEWQVEEFQARTGIRCLFTLSVTDLQADREVVTAMFRILQETLTNVARHADATSVGITLKEDASRLILSVEDNGRGIGEQEMFDTKSLGLIGMRERAHLLQGDFGIVGRRGEGTTVTVALPLMPSTGLP